MAIRGCNRFVSTIALCLVIIASAAQCIDCDANAQQLDVSPGVSPSATARDLSAILEPLLKRYHLPGMVAAIVRDADVIAIGAAGVRERGRPEAVTVDDQFHLGSETKAMTATLCAILVEQGKLRWDTTLAEVFPDLNAAMLPQLRSVTLAQLLSQRSGIAENLLGDTKLIQTQADLQGTPLESRQACLKFAITQKLAAPPGTMFIYSNTNYVIAGHMVEKVMGRSWEDLIHDRLFVPLGMMSAGFGAPGQAGIFDQPRGHLADDQPVEPGPDADNPAMYGPSGLVHSSMRDWAKFTALHATKGESQPGFLSPESFSVLQTPVKSGSGEPKLNAVAAGSDGYAMGWFVFPGGVLAHSGTNLRWFAKLAIIPKDRLSVLVVCNQGGDGAEAGCDKAIQILINDYYKRHGER